MTEDGASLLALIFGNLTCTKFFSCNRDLDQNGGIALWFLLMLYMFKALGTICDEYFVPSLEVIVEKLQVSNDVAGATFMAAGSSAPELFTNLVATFLIVNAGGVGTIVGSAIFNILVMNGVTAYVACRDQELKIWWYPLARDSCFYSLAILELVLVLLDEEVKWYEGFCMILTYLVYCLYMKFNPHIVDFLGMSKDEAQDCFDAVGPSKEESLNCSAKVCPDEAQDETAAETVGRQSELDHGERKSWSYRKSSQQPGRSSSSGRFTPPCAKGPSCRSGVPPVQESESSNGNGFPSENLADNPQDSSSVEIPPESENEVPAIQEEPSVGSEGKGRRSWCRDPLCILWEFTLPPPERLHGFALFIGSIAWIGACTYVMVDSTNRMGVILRVPSFVMGLIFLAAGTSIPDTLSSIAVAKQGEGDMAVANALGSNVFDILVGLGVPWTIRASYQEVIFKDQFNDLIGDIIILVVVLFLFVASLAINGWKLNKRIGFVLIAFYVIFVVYQMLAVFVVKSKGLSEH